MRKQGSLLGIQLVCRICLICMWLQPAMRSQVAGLIITATAGFYILGGLLCLGTIKKGMAAALHVIVHDTSHIIIVVSSTVWSADSLLMAALGLYTVLHATKLHSTSQVVVLSMQVSH